MHSLIKFCCLLLCFGFGISNPCPSGLLHLRLDYRTIALVPDTSWVWPSTRATDRGLCLLILTSPITEHIAPKNKTKHNKIMRIIYGIYYSPRRWRFQQRLHGTPWMSVVAAKWFPVPKLRVTGAWFLCLLRTKLRTTPRSHGIETLHPGGDYWD